jgi:hypothetical protein
MEHNSNGSIFLKDISQLSRDLPALDLLEVREDINQDSSTNSRIFANYTVAIATIEKQIEGSKDTSQLSRDLSDRDLLEVREDINQDSTINKKIVASDAMGVTTTENHAKNNKIDTLSEVIEHTIGSNYLFVSASILRDKQMEQINEVLVSIHEIFQEQDIVVTPGLKLLEQALKNTTYEDLSELIEFVKKLKIYYEYNLNKETYYYLDLANIFIYNNSGKLYVSRQNIDILRRFSNKGIKNLLDYPNRCIKLYIRNIKFSSQRLVSQSQNIFIPTCQHIINLQNNSFFYKRKDLSKKLAGLSIEKAYPVTCFFNKVIDELESRNILMFAQFDKFTEVLIKSARDTHNIILLKKTLQSIYVYVDSIPKKNNIFCIDIIIRKMGEDYNSLENIQEYFKSNTPFMLPFNNENADEITSSSISAMPQQARDTVNSSRKRKTDMVQEPCVSGAPAIKKYKNDVIIIE